VKDEYIEYLQRQIDENNQNVMRLESKLNELQKRYKNLIDDNRILNDTLNERNNKLNECLQENENLRIQINNYADNESKYRLQIQYCEKQIGLYETNINDYNNIIKDLKSSNEKLASNLTQKLDNNKNNKQGGSNNSNNNYSTNNSNNYNNYNYFNVKNVRSDNDVELQFLKNQNMIYLNNIKSKESTIDFIQKKMKS
jgi:chromosome segregation ATPase